MVAGSFIVSFVMVALIRLISRRMGWYDHINERKIHSGDIPRLGGLGFVVSFLIFAGIVKFRSPGFLKILPLLPACALILFSGVRDDFKPMAPRPKMILHLGAALCAMAAGYTVKRAFSGGGDLLAFPGWSLLRYPLTLLWIVGMTNAVNFIDGVDGLAGGVSLLALLAFGGIFSFLGSGSPLLCLCLAAAILGFLVFNAPLPRARIFMGDGGAYFLGFTLALFPLSENNPLNLPILHAAAILLIPILDTTAAVWRRLRDHRPIDSPDKSHTHHKLMILGLSSRRIDAILFTLQISLGLLVFAGIRTGFSLLFLLLAYGLGVGFFAAVHFLNRRHNRLFGFPPGAGQKASQKTDQGAGQKTGSSGAGSP
jgi:UDP-GlcNAc:undecaprenyl-phosphate GlcNAc-1-phosphate transferase